MYPLPKPEDIFSTMANCAYFSVLDLADAYTQLELDEQSQELATVNTHKRSVSFFFRLMYGMVCTLQQPYFNR